MFGIRKLKTEIEHLKGVIAMRTYKGNDTPCSKWIEALKDRVYPHPHWKPSEEQMEALKHAYSMMNGQAGTDLSNLYYDLKKLM